MVIVSRERKKTVVFTWELGGGMGHTVPYFPLVHSLQAMGQEVIFILRDLSRVEGLLCRSGVTCLHAPFPLPYPELGGQMVECQDEGIGAMGF